MVTWQQIAQGEPNPFDIVTTSTDGYSANYDEYVITDQPTVSLPSPKANAAVGIRGYEQTIRVSTPSGSIIDFGTSADYKGPEPLIFVSDGTDWYVQNDEQQIDYVIFDSVIDQFEDNDLGEYAGSFGSPGWEIVTSPVLEGSYTVKGVTDNSGGHTIASTSGLDRYPEQGYEHRWLVQVDQVTSDGEFWIGYASQSETGGVDSRPNGYQIRVKPYAPKIELVSGGGSGSIGTITLSEFLADTTYDLRLEWRTDDTHRIELLDLSGNSLGEATLTNSDYSSGGISMEAQSGGSGITVYIDDISRSSL